MKIAGMEKLRLQDYPNHMSCIIFTQGCNMRCPFCHNSSLIPLEGDSEVPEEEFFELYELEDLETGLMNNEVLIQI